MRRRFWSPPSGGEPSALEQRRVGQVVEEEAGEPLALGSVAVAVAAQRSAVEGRVLLLDEVL